MGILSEPGSWEQDRTGSALGLRVRGRGLTAFPSLWVGQVSEIRRGNN